MKKLYIILGVLALFVFIASPAIACHGEKCHDNIHPKINVTVIKPNISPVIKPNISPVIKPNISPVIKPNISPVIKPNISPVIKPNFDNTDEQAQEQGQMNDWTQIYEDKRDHITGPNVLQSDAKLSSGRAFSAKVQGAKAFFSNVSEMTNKQAKKLASKASDITCEPALLMENEFATDKIKCTYFGKRLPGQYMGYLYMGSDGDDVNTLAMIGDAGDEAMEAGATHMRLVFMDCGEMAEGDSWNIGLGGGASIMSGGAERLAVAPNGGLGIGHADAFNELRPEMVFELTFDKALTSKYKLSQATHGWDANLIEDEGSR